MKEKQKYNVGQVQSDVHTKKLHTYHIIPSKFLSKFFTHQLD